MTAVDSLSILVAMTHKSIIDMWPTHSALAADLGLNAATVHKWHARDSIPARLWNAVVRAGRERGYPVSLESLAVAAEQAA